MTSKELELIGVTSQQYKALLVMQGKAYKKVLNSYKAYIDDSEKIKMIDKKMAVIEATIITELEDIKKQNKLLLNN